MQYIGNTKNMTLMIEPDDKAKRKVDSSYAVHPDLKSHTGIYMTLGKGATYTASCKQKINTKSLTEAEKWWLWMTQWGKCYGLGTS